MGRQKSLSIRASLITIQSEIFGIQFRRSSRFAPELVRLFPSVFAQHFKPSAQTTTATPPKQGTKFDIHRISVCGKCWYLSCRIRGLWTLWTLTVTPRGLSLYLSLSLPSLISKSLKPNEKPETGWCHCKFIHLILSEFQKITVGNRNTTITSLNTSLCLHFKYSEWQSIIVG
jgi:hypothetical protein